MVKVTSPSYGTESTEVETTKPGRLDATTPSALLKGLMSATLNVGALFGERREDATGDDERGDTGGRGWLETRWMQA